MPGHKRRYSVRFQPGRVKKIMQKDAEVGRIAMAVPVLIYMDINVSLSFPEPKSSARALELFLKSLLTKTFLITQSKVTNVLSIAHIKQCIESELLFHFLKDVLEDSATKQQKDPKNMSIWPLYRPPHAEIPVKKKKPEVKEKAPRQSLDSFNDDCDSSEPELYICL